MKQKLKTVYYSTFQTKIGKIFYAHDKSNILSVSLQGTIPASLKKMKNEVILSKKSFSGFEREIKQYFKGNLKIFKTRVAPLGVSAFTSRILKELVKIPFGKTISYAELAKKAGSKNAYRAAGSACGKNPCPLIIPCHRVIKADGSLGGFTGGLSYKRKLLKTENVL